MSRMNIAKLRNKVISKYEELENKRSHEVDIELYSLGREAVTLHEVYLECGGSDYYINQSLVQRKKDLADLEFQLNLPKTIFKELDKDNRDELVRKYFRQHLEQENDVQSSDIDLVEKVSSAISFGSGSLTLFD